MNALPADILVTICCDFLFLKDFVRLDSAICNHAHRNHFLSAMPLLTLPPVKNRLYCGRFDGEEHIHWLIRRNISVRKVRINTIGRNKDCVSSFLTHNSHRLKSLQAFSWDDANDRDTKWFREFLQLCPNLLHVHLSGVHCDLSALVVALAHNCPGLHTAAIRCSVYGGISEASVEQLIRRCTKLTTLYLWQCRFSFQLAQQLFNSNVKCLAADRSHAKLVKRWKTSMSAQLPAIYIDCNDDNKLHVIWHNVTMTEVCATIMHELSYEECNCIFSIEANETCNVDGLLPLIEEYHQLTTLTFSNCTGMSSDTLIAILLHKNLIYVYLYNNNTISSINPPGDIEFEHYSLTYRGSIRIIRFSNFTALTNADIVSLTKYCCPVNTMYIGNMPQITISDRNIKLDNLESHESGL